jgi:serine/threonine protein kinase
MNQLGVIHNDLKSENLMMDTANPNVRVIDWGLAGIATPQHPIPEHHFMNNPVTFNRPFSTMLISRDIDALYHEFISRLPAKFEPEQLEPFIIDLYNIYQKMAPTGHAYFTYIFKTMFKLNTEMATLVLKSTLERYNAKILYHFTHAASRKFKLHDYFNKVYRFNTDVWGTVSVFYSMFMLPRDHFIMPDSVYHDMLQRYRSIFRTMVFVNGHKRMNVQRIAQQLRQISDAVAVTTGRFNKFNNTKINNNKFNKFNKSVKKMVRFNIDADTDTDTDKDVHKKTHNYRGPTPYPFKMKT